MKALAFIKRYTDIEAFPPTRRELGVHMEWSSPSTAQKMVDALERKGLIERKRFGIVRLTDLGRSVLENKVAA